MIPADAPQANIRFLKLIKVGPNIHISNNAVYLLLQIENFRYDSSNTAFYAGGYLENTPAQ